MTRVIADEGLKAKLKDFSEGLEICDASGKLVGYFQPILNPNDHRELYDWAKAQFTEEELELARKDPVMYTTAEVLEYLRSL